MQDSNHNDQNFTVVRCNECHKVLLEVSNGTTGIVKKKCDKCKTMRIISLPLIAKNNNLQSVGAFAPA